MNAPLRGAPWLSLSAREKPKSLNRANDVTRKIRPNVFEDSLTLVIIFSFSWHNKQ
jgi:hypothetical protein